MEADENRFEGMLKGKTVVLAVTASVSIYRMPDLVRDLRREGATVVVGMSREAASMISPTIFQWASENPVITEVSGNVEHINLFIGHAGDTALLVSPASYNSIGKMANGLSDDVPSLFFSFAIGNGNPVCVCPAMHEGMMINPINQMNLEKLKNAGVSIVPPRISEEKAKVSENDIIVDYVCRSFSGSPLAGKNILIIGGRGAEMIDPVRAITNLGTGFTFTWFGINAFRLGAARIFMIGNTAYRVPEYSEFIPCETMDEFEEMVPEILKDNHFDVVINCASLPDFKVSKKAGKKISSTVTYSLSLEPRGKLLDRIREIYSGLLVAFKLDHAMRPSEIRDKFKGSRPDAIVFNPLEVTNGPFGPGHNSYSIITERGIMELGVLSKPAMTLNVLRAVAEMVA